MPVQLTQAAGIDLDNCLTPEGAGGYPEAAAYTEYGAYTNAPGACRDGLDSCELPKQKAYSTTYYGNAATDFIDTAPASKPVFVYYTPYAPHAPSIPQLRYPQRFPHLKPYRPPSFNEANVSDKPPWIRQLPRFDGIEDQQIDADRRGQFQTLLTVDNEVAAIVRALRQTHRLLALGRSNQVDRAHLVVLAPAIPVGELRHELDEIVFAGVMPGVAGASVFIDPRYDRIISHNIEPTATVNTGDGTRLIRTGDRVRLADTSLYLQVEKDLTHYGDECKFGGGKTIRDLRFRLG